MLFLSVLIAVLVERLVSNWRPGRRHRWFAGYRRLAGAWPLADRLSDSTFGLALLLVPPLLLVGLAAQIAGAAGDLIELAFAALVLVYTLGPRNLRADVETYAEAQDAGDDVAADEAAAALCGNPPPRHEPARSVAIARGVLGEAGPRLFGPLFWFVLLGPVGAAAYRLVHLLATPDGDDADATPNPHADELRRLADWLPTRAGLVTYAAAGNFDAVRRTWRAAPEDGQPHTADTLLGEGGLAALGVDGAAADHAMPTTDGEAASGWYVDEAVGLVGRAVMVWLAVLGVASLVAWIN
jgi:membrane protein required for beta-lactamase induction